MTASSKTALGAFLVGFLSIVAMDASANPLNPRQGAGPSAMASTARAIVTAHVLAQQQGNYRLRRPTVNTDCTMTIAGTQLQKGKDPFGRRAARSPVVINGPIYNLC